jgi:uncharacterized protein
MDEEMFLHEYKDAQITNSMAVIGFPSIGLVSSIAANYIVRSMKLERIATIISKDFPPYTILHDGIPTPPVRIYAGKRICDGDGEKCEQIVVILSEFMPRPDLLKRLSQIILDWCQKKGIDTILTLEGVNISDNPQETRIFGVGTTAKTKRMLETYRISEMREGMVSGISGLLLSEGDRQSIDVMCLLGPAKADMPDAGGAARLLEIIGEMLPEIKLDPQPLRKEAEGIEREMKTAMESMKQIKKPGEESTLYG